MRRVRKQSGGTVFPTNAIQTCLTLKVLFGLPLRPTVGLVASLIKWPVPDYPTLHRRQTLIAVQIPIGVLASP
ncbi:hypothetical protein D2T31_00005 [Sinirhodobacter populi]|uniref:Transposase DDE domain-containing protein n=1 Tax=Paenirhodobacter populi TaxID=2306993 RepID=A0A443KI18_9RHOB|nr:hypothetical protein D2T31_00005 [Sinirhodobacter populi]